MLKAATVLILKEPPPSSVVLGARVDRSVFPILSARGRHLAQAMMQSSSRDSFPDQNGKNRPPAGTPSTIAGHGVCVPRRAGKLRNVKLNRALRARVASASSRNCKTCCHAFSAAELDYRLSSEEIIGEEILSGPPHREWQVS